MVRGEEPVGGGGYPGDRGEGWEEQVRSASSELQKKNKEKKRGEE